MSLLSFNFFLGIQYLARKQALGPDTGALKFTKQCPQLAFHLELFLGSKEFGCAKIGRHIGP